MNIYIIKHLCGTLSGPDPTSSSSSLTAAIIGVVVAILIIGTIVLIMSILIVRARQTQSKVVAKKPDQQ